MPLHIYDTRTRSKQPFRTEQPRIARVYTCGLTVYAPMHIGHARTYCFWDLFRRYLEYRGYHVVMVINYTDIDDRIIGAATDSRGWLDVAETMAARFKIDCRALNIKDFSAYTRATDFIAEQIDAVAAILAKGYAYVVDGEVLYDTSRFDNYGQLSGNTLANLESGASGRLTEEAKRKRHPADFTLWKPSKPGEPEWKTGHADWPSGRPGWHIECSVMATALLGQRLDMHGGAVDNMFPHHENELAQSEVLYPAPWCNTWMHPEHLDLRNEQNEPIKMSKSLGNVISVPALLDRYSANEVRWFFGATHYRSKLTFNWSAVDSVLQGYKKVEKLVGILAERLGGTDPEARAIRCRGTYASERAGDRAYPRDRESLETGQFAEHNRALITGFMAAMDDDLNGPQATAAIFEYVHALYSGGVENCDDLPSLLAAYRCLTRHLHVLGAEYPDVELYPELAADSFPSSGDDKDLGGVIDRMLALRQKARKAKDFAKADLIRDLLDEAGLEVEDTPKGPRWSAK